MAQEPSPEPDENAACAKASSAQPMAAGGTTTTATSHGEVCALGETGCFRSLYPSLLHLRDIPLETVTFAPDDVIFRQGEHGDDAFVILDGTVDLEVDGRDEPTRLAEVGGRTSIGECALFCDGPRWATARAVTEVSALRLSREGFEQLVMEYPSVGLAIIRTLGRRLSTALGCLRASPPGTEHATGAGACYRALGNSVARSSDL